MYQSAQSGECPLVVDDTTPSCGNSRFGCWTCTVVTRDKSMEAMIDSGEEWMLPLLEFRDWLTETQDPAKKHLYRRHKRRTGEVLVIGKTHDDKPIRGIKNIDLYIKETGEEIKEGMIVRGPYELWFRQEMLRRLLGVQAAVRANGPDPKQTLITEAELHEIRRLWRTEEYDWADSLPAILDQLCETHELPVKLVAGLLEEERQMQGMHRRSGIFQRLDTVLGEEWRDEESIRQAYNLPLLLDIDETDLP
jgi:DNA sulfur modification protein DndC